MPELSSIVGMTWPDPLVIVLGLFAVGVAASRLLFRRYPLGRAIVRVIFLILLTIALLRAGITPYAPLKATGTPFFDVVHAILKIAWWLWAAWFAVSLLRATLVIEHLPHEGRLLQDLISGLIYLAALFAIVGYVFDLPVTGLLATSGAIAIILGLALQSTLGDVFSGIVLNFSRPYRPGDWIRIDGDTSGRVIETTWRATHILTAQRDLAILPNSAIAKSKIVNISSPSGVHGVTTAVQIAATTPPSIAIEFLRRAILNCRLILEAPAPSVTVKSMNAAYIEFGIDFFVEQLGSTNQAQNELLDLIYRHLSAAGIDLAAPANLPLHVRDRDASMVSPSSPERVLEYVAVFATLTPAERADIAGKLKRCCYEQGDIVLASGTVMTSLCIIGGGVLSVSRDDGEVEEELMRLGPTDHFGEIGVMTGAATVVRITALTPVIVYELAKEELAPILESHSEVSQALHRTLASRQATVSPPAESEPDAALHHHRLRGWIADWLHRRYDAAASQ